MDDLIPQAPLEDFPGDYAEQITAVLAQIFLLLRNFLGFLLQYGADQPVSMTKYTDDEKEDWSAILLFIMIVKCRASIDKILDTEEDE